MKKAPRKAPPSFTRKKAKVQAAVEEAGHRAPEEMSREDIYLYYQAVGEARDRVAAAINLIECTEKDDAAYFDADFRYDDRDTMIEELQRSVQCDQERVHVDDIRQSLRDTSRWFETTIKNTSSFLEMIEEEKAELTKSCLTGEVGAADGAADDVILRDGEYNSGLAERTIEELRAMSDASTKQEHFTGVWSRLHRAKQQYEADMEEVLLEVRARIGEEVAEVREREKAVDTQLAYLRLEKKAVDQAAATERGIKKIIEGKYKPAVQSMERTIEEKLQEIEALEEQVAANAADFKRVDDMCVELATERAAADPFVRQRAAALVYELLELLYSKELEAAERVQGRIGEEEARIAARLLRERELRAEVEGAEAARTAAEQELVDARVRCAQERVQFRETVVRLREESMVLATQVRMLDDIVREGQRVQRRHQYMERREQQLRAGGRQLEQRYDRSHAAGGYTSDEEGGEGIDADLVAALLGQASGALAPSPPAEQLWPNPSPTRAPAESGEGDQCEGNEYLQMSIFKEGPPARRPREVVVHSEVHAPVLSCACAAAYAVSQQAHRSRRARLLMRRRRTGAARPAAAPSFKLGEAFAAIDRVLLAMAAAQCIDASLAGDFRRKLEFMRREFNMLSRRGGPPTEIESSLKGMCLRIIESIVRTSPRQLLLSNDASLLPSVLLHVFVVVAVAQNSAQGGAPRPLWGLGQAEEQALELLSRDVICLVASDVQGGYRNPAPLLESLRLHMHTCFSSLAGAVDAEGQLLRLLDKVASLDLADAAAVRAPLDTHHLLRRLEEHLQRQLDAAAAGTPFSRGPFSSAHSDALRALEVLLFLSTHPHVARSPGGAQRLAVELLARGALRASAGVKDSYVECADPVPMGDLAALEELVHPALLPALISVHVFRRLMEEELLRARFVADIGAGGAALADLRYLNVALPQQVLSSAHKPRAAAAAAQPPEDMRAVHSQWVEDMAALLEGKVRELHCALHGVGEGGSNLGAALRDKLGSHAELLLRCTALRSSSSGAAVMSSQRDYEDCMLGIQSDRARIVSVLQALLHPWERRLLLLQGQHTQLLQLRSERAFDADVLRARTEQVQAATKLLEADFAEYKKSKAVSDEALRILCPPEDSEQIKYLRFESFNYQKTYRELRRELSSKKTELENLNSQKKLLLDMLLMHKAEHAVEQAAEPPRGSFLPRQHHRLEPDAREQQRPEDPLGASLQPSRQPAGLTWRQPPPRRTRRPEPPRPLLSVLGPHTLRFIASARSAPLLADTKEQQQEQELLLPERGKKKKARKSLAFVGDGEYNFDADFACAGEEPLWFDEWQRDEGAPAGAFAAAEVAESLLKIVLGLPRDSAPPPVQEEAAPPFPRLLAAGALPMQVTVTIRPRAVFRGEAPQESHSRESPGERPEEEEEEEDARSEQEDKTVVSIEQYLPAGRPHPTLSDRPARADTLTAVALQMQQAKRYGLVRGALSRRVQGGHPLLKPHSPSVEVWNFSHPTERSFIRVSEFIRNESEGLRGPRSPAGDSRAPQEASESRAPPAQGRDAALLHRDLSEAFRRINQLDLLETDRLLQLARPQQPAAPQPSRQQRSPRYKEK